MLGSGHHLVQWHPHGHLLTRMEVSPTTASFTLGSWDPEAVMKLFHERLLARVVARHAISDGLARKLVAWTHPGFSSHIAQAIPFQNKKAIGDLARWRRVGAAVSNALAQLEAMFVARFESES